MTIWCWRWLCGLFWVGSCCAGPVQPLAREPGWVSWVMDGDTLQVLLDGRHEPIKLRLKDIDAPEICQPGGEASRNALVVLTLRQRVQVQLVAEDVYGRWVARVWRGDLDVGAEMVRTGMAWAYRFRVGQGPYARGQKQAQKERLGLFASEEPPMSPPVFRQFHGSCHGG